MTTYKFVPEHNGIEIYFDEKPSTSVCEELKENGWRWHRVKRCWFTKKSSDAEALAKKLCGEKPTEKASAPQPASVSPTQTKEVSFQQTSGSAYVSTATIRRNEQGFWVASTNNQIICCDCGRFFSVHTVGCPFCGCPMSYIAEHYLKKFDSSVLAEQKRQRDLEIQRQRKEDAQRKATLIRKLIADCKHYRSAFYELEKLDMEVFDKTIDRAFHLESTVGDTSFISNENWREMLLSSEVFFQKCIKRATEINKHKDELDVNDKNNWEHVISLSDRGFEEYIQNGIEKHRAKEKKDIEEMCQKRGIPPEKIAWLIDSGVSAREVRSRFSYMDYVSEEYRRYNFNIKEYIHLSTAEMRKIVASWIK